MGKLNQTEIDALSAKIKSEIIRIRMSNIKVSTTVLKRIREALEMIDEANRMDTVARDLRNTAHKQITDILGHKNYNSVYYHFNKDEKSDEEILEYIRKNKVTPLKTEVYSEIRREVILGQVDGLNVSEIVDKIVKKFT